MQRKGRGETSYLADMLSFAREVLTFTEGRSRADYKSDTGLRRSVERATELIGEAATNISDATRAERYLGTSFVTIPSRIDTSLGISSSTRFHTRSSSTSP